MMKVQPDPSQDIVNFHHILFASLRFVVSLQSFQNKVVSYPVDNCENGAVVAVRTGNVLVQIIIEASTKWHSWRTHNDFWC